MGQKDELNALLHRRMEALANSVDTALASEQMQRWLRFCADMPSYSWRNLWLALWQDPDATHIAPKRHWAALGRDLIDDARPIFILKPTCGPKAQPLTVEIHGAEEDTAEAANAVCRTSRASGSSSRLWFVEVPVYDVRHTHGEPLPEINWRSAAKRESLAAALDAFAAERGIFVTIKPLAGLRQGSASRMHIEISPDAGTKTRVHELAHVLLGHCEAKAWMTPELKEWQAEMVAWVVCHHFALPDLNCPTYLAGWGATARKLKTHFAVCAQASRDIILGLERLMGHASLIAQRDEG